MKFSVYYRIQQRDTYFSRFFSQVSKKFSPELVNEAESKYEDLMELVVKYLIDEDSHSMKILLTKPNAKVARMFFDYLTISNVKLIPAANAPISRHITKSAKTKRSRISFSLSIIQSGFGFVLLLIK